MTRKHFIAIAATLNANRAPLALVQDMADVLAETNPNFDRPRFILASTGQMVNIMEYDLRKIKEGTA